MALALNSVLATSLNIVYDETSWAELKVVEYRLAGKDTPEEAATWGLSIQAGAVYS